MKWEPNIVGYPISIWPKQADTQMSGGAPVDHSYSVTALPNIMDLSDNIMLAHYQSDRR